MEPQNSTTSSGDASEKILFLSPRRRRVFQSLGIVLALGALLTAALLTIPPHLQPGYLLPLAGVVALISIVFMVVFNRAVIPDDRCAFCARPRSEVKYLIAAPATSICESCTGLTMGILASQYEGDGDVASLYELHVEALPGSTPHSLSQAMVDVVVAQAPDDVDHLRRAAATAFALNNPALAESVLRRIPEGERTSGVLVNLGVALGRQRKYEEAEAVTQKALALDDPGDRAYCLNNLAWFYGHHRGGDDPEGIAQKLADVAEARQLVVENDLTDQSMLAYCAGTEALLHHVAGDGETALQVLADSEEHYPLIGERYLLRAKIQLSMEDLAGARESLEQAKQNLHPETEDAREVALLIDQLNQ